MTKSNAFNLKGWIIDTFFKNGKSISKRLKKEWILKNKFQSYYDILILKTNFLDNKSSLPQRMWHIMHDYDKKYICNNPICKNDTKFNTFNKGYRRTCSIKCAQFDPQTINKIKSTNMSRYGNEYGLGSEDIKKKIKITVNEKYGVDNVSSIEDVKKKKENTCLRNHGVNYYLSKQTEKEDAVSKKYGVKNIMQVDSVKNKMVSTKLRTNYKNLFLNNRFKDKVSPLFSIEEYTGVIDKEYQFRCNTCNNTFISKMEDGDIPRCYTCYPVKGSSIFEKEVYEYISILTDNVECNNKTILKGKEIDIFIPELSIGIECDGLYWHGESFGNKNKNYHLNKTKECEVNNIHLIHIFEDEWIHKSDIVKSKLQHLFNKNDQKVYARNCIVKEICSKECNEFLFKNHIQGHDKSNIRLGIYYNNEIVGVMTFGKLRKSLGNISKPNHYELYRFCTSKHIIGGASKLLKHFIRQYSPDEIITYADRRWTHFRNNVYERLGFVKMSDTNPNYWYFGKGTDYKRFHRYAFAKHTLHQKLKTFDNSLTEWQNMKLNGYDRIWDCGNLKYIMKCQYK
jgi:hypothetical protein